MRIEIERPSIHLKAGDLLKNLAAAENHGRYIDHSHDHWRDTMALIVLPKLAIASY
jgi:hypothetical protein